MPRRVLDMTSCVLNISGFALHILYVSKISLYSTWLWLYRYYKWPGFVLKITWLIPKYDNNRLKYNWVCPEYDLICPEYFCICPKSGLFCPNDDCHFLHFQMKHQTPTSVRLHILSAILLPWPQLSLPAFPLLSSTPRTVSRLQEQFLKIITRNTTKQKKDSVMFTSNSNHIWLVTRSWLDHTCPANWVLIRTLKVEISHHHSHPFHKEIS